MKIGVDIVQISRLKNMDVHFKDRVLTSREQEIYDKRGNKEEFLAARWAAKEAIFKATNDIHYLEYSVLNDEKGKPYVEGHPEILITISHEKEYAVAFVVIE